MIYSIGTASVHGVIRGGSWHFHNRGGRFIVRKKWISEQFGFFLIKLYGGVIRSEDYKTREKVKNDKDELGSIRLKHVFTSL